MSLLDRQRAFLEALADPDDALPPDLPDRLRDRFGIYRNAYRTVLTDALAETFPRTAALVGEDAFRAAAAHHVITRPPSSWTLDRAGNEFPVTLDELFAEDPDVAAVAALEWAMHIVFVAEDSVPLGPADFARETSAFDELAWSEMRLQLAPALQSFATRFDLTAFWTGASEAPRQLADDQRCVVWRDNEQPVFIQLKSLEGGALDEIADGMTFGELCNDIAATGAGEAAVEICGTWLGLWIARGWVTGISTDPIRQLGELPDCDKARQKLRQRVRSRGRAGSAFDHLMRINH